MAGQIKINDKELKCLVCGKEEFDEVNVKINTRAGAWFPILEVAGVTGKAYICRYCGFKHEFYK